MPSSLKDFIYGGTLRNYCAVYLSLYRGELILDDCMGVRHAGEPYGIGRVGRFSMLCGILFL
jgi:hypothetical protein